MNATTPVVLRNIFPARSQCPECRKYGHANISGGHSGVPVHHRRCNHCGCTYKVAPIAREVDDGGAWSRVEVLS